MAMKDRTIISATDLGNKTLIKYSDKTEETYMHSKDDNSTSKTDETKPANNGSYKSSSSSSYGTGYNSGGYSHYSSQSMKPTLAFEFEYDSDKSIQFWGCAKSNLDMLSFDENDLIINLTGISWEPPKQSPPKLFTKTIPAWMNIPNILLEPQKKHCNGEVASQLILDWPDMKEPPEDATLEMWESILSESVKNNISRIICCCTAGQGRTGTALASFLLATGAVSEPDKAIGYIRGSYSKSAIETTGQEKYLFNLIYKEVSE